MESQFFIHIYILHMFRGSVLYKYIQSQFIHIHVEQMLRAVCCSVLQYVAVCCSVLQCVAVCCSALREL